MMLRTFPKTKSPPCSLLVILGCWLSLWQPSWGQQTDDATPPPTPNSKVSLTDPATPLEDLKLLIKPLTVTELKETANQWQAILQAKMTEIAHLRIDMRSSNTPQQEDELLKLVDEKGVIARHFGAVIDELEIKGGDTKELRQYAVSAAGVTLDYTNPTTVWKMIVSWIYSEDGGKRWAWNFFKFALILVGFYIGASIVANLICRFVAHVKGTSQLLISFLRTFTKQLLMLLGLVMALNALEVDITPMLAALGAAGFAIGLALKDTMGNFASGTMILAYRPFDVGDQIDAAGVNGLVESVSLSATHIRTFDNQLIIVPNSKIWGDIITNKTASDTRRVDMVFGIGYDDDIELAKKTLESLLQEHPLVLADPTPVVKLHELADSSVNFICRPWAKTADYWAVYWDITRSVKETFDQEGISIPYPQRDVHLYQQSPSADPGARS